MTGKVYMVLSEKKKDDHDGSRTRNLTIRSRAPYPLGHAAGYRKIWKYSLLKASNQVK